jgi:hypothetical protein
VGTGCGSDVAGLVEISELLACLSALGRGLTRGSTAFRMIAVGLTTSSDCESLLFLSKVAVTPKARGVEACLYGTLTSVGFSPLLYGTLVSVGFSSVGWRIIGDAVGEARIVY